MLNIKVQSCELSFVYILFPINMCMVSYYIEMCSGPYEEKRNKENERKASILKYFYYSNLKNLEDI